MLKVDFINVGYGDSILVRLGKEEEVTFSMLVDCGDITIGEITPESKRISAVDFLKKEGIKELDLLVITHLHLDHTGGLSQLTEEIGIKTLWVNYLPPEKYWGTSIQITREISPGALCLITSLNIYLQALETLKNRGTQIVFHNKDNQQVCLSEELQIDIFMEEELLERQERIWAETLEGNIFNEELNKLDLFINNASLRMRLSYGGRTVELPGDIYAVRWERKELPSCDIVKIPHHGHRDSMTEKLSAMLRPEYAVISVSNSRTDCPNPEVVATIRAHAKELLFTDGVTTAAREPVYQNAVRFSIDESGLIHQIT